MDAQQSQCQTAASASGIELHPLNAETMIEANDMLQVSDQSQELPTTDDFAKPVYGTQGVRFAVLYVCILLANFFMGYDTSCVATLTTVITDEFHALQDLGWYTVAYLLTQCATMLIYGQLYSLFSMKTLLLASLLVFVVGSVLSAAAPTSPAFIVGRALSGWGAAGVFAGTTIIIANVTSLKTRPIYLAVTGGVETCALAFGPLISGAIAHGSTWRLSFYIIIPFGVAIFVALLFSIGHIRRPEHVHLDRKERFKRVDWTGFAVNVPMILCLVLGLQWGGLTYPWSNWRIILVLTLAAVLLVLFVIVEYRKGAGSMVPLRMIRQRSVVFASLVTFCNYAHLSIIAYYLPLYFQAVRGANTVTSGLMYLPTALALGIAGLVGGPLTTYVGYCNVALVIGSVLMTVGAGLITTFAPSTSEGKQIAYQAIYGIGVGLAFQPPYISVQTILDDSLVPMGLVMLTLAQQIGGVSILSVAQNVFLTGLTRNLGGIAGLDPETVLNSGALGLINAVPASQRDQALAAYNGAVVQVFYIALGLTGVATVAAFGIEWRSIKKDEKK